MVRPLRQINPREIRQHPFAKYAQSIRLIHYRRGPDFPVYEAEFRLHGEGEWSPPSSTKETDWTLACCAAVEEMARREAGKAPPSRTDRTFAKAAETAIAALEEQGKAARAAGRRTFVGEEISHIRTITRYFGHMTISEIEDTDVQAFLEDVTVGVDKRKPSKGAIRSYSLSWGNVMRVAIANGWIKKKDRLTISLRGFEEGLPRSALNPEEVIRLYHFMTNEWVAAGKGLLQQEERRLTRAFVALGLATGIRPGEEMKGIRVSHVTFEPEWVHIHIPAETAKTREERAVIAYMNTTFEVRPLLRDLVKGRDDDDYIFSRFGGRFHGAMPRYSIILNRLYRAAGIPKRDPRTRRPRSAHSLRHHYATQALMRNMSLNDLAKNMGTSPEMIARHYDNVTAEMKAPEFSGVLDHKARDWAERSRRRPGQPAPNRYEEHDIEERELDGQGPDEISVAA